jgi:hypothetical protein
MSWEYNSYNAMAALDWIEPDASSATYSLNAFWENLMTRSVLEAHYEAKRVTSCRLGILCASYLVLNEAAQSRRNPCMLDIRGRLYIVLLSDYN